MSKRNKMPGLRCKSGIWHIEKRSEYRLCGWLRESTGTSDRREAEAYLIRRLAELEHKATQKTADSYTFEEAGLRYLQDIAHKASAETMAMHLDQLFPFIGALKLEAIHDGTLAAFVAHEKAREISPKSINNALGVVSTVLNSAARVWRNGEGRPWLCQAPPKLTRQAVKGQQAKAYPLTWHEQDRLFKQLPAHLQSAVLFDVNTGCREQEVCRLQWDWEFAIPDLNTTVFVLPTEVTKTSEERIVVLNSTAQRVIENMRGQHPTHVFSYRGHPMKKLHSSAWKRAWQAAALPTEKGVLKGVHNLRHTFGKRLRAAGVSLETRKALLGHTTGDITTHYSAAEINELIEAAEKVTDRSIAQTPTLTTIKNSIGFDVGKVSEKKKRGRPETGLTL